MSPTNKLKPGASPAMPGRRGFVKKSSLLGFAAALGSQLPFGRLLPNGLSPVVFAAGNAVNALPANKQELILLNEQPFAAETPAHLLDDAVTPNKYMFVRNNGIVPVNVNPAQWELEISGESCARPTRFSLTDLRQQFEEVTLQLQIEGAGNGRREFAPQVEGYQWSTGAIGCPAFTGVRLRDVLLFCGLKDDALFIAYHGADTHSSGDPDRDAISRGVPLKKALEAETLIAWAMNGEDLPLQNGYPLRLVCAGWPGSVSGKWLKKLVVRNVVHDGEKMAAPYYSMPKQPVAPGTPVANADMKTIESMPIKSLITFPQSGINHNLRERLTIRGHAWAGDKQVSAVFLSIDFGKTWVPTATAAAANRHAWQNWQSWVEFPEAGYYEIWARAMDESGMSQPMQVPGWNPGGYLNNLCHRVAVQVV